MSNSRFVYDSPGQFQEVNRNPIFDYEDSPVLTLQEAVQRITTPISRMQEYVTTALTKCNQHSSLLTRNESAAVYLYTMPTSIYSRLNTVIRERNQHELPSWYAFLKLLITALKKLPSTRATIWRGIYSEGAPVYVDSEIDVWWSVSSCSKNPQSVSPYLSEGGTLFAIEAVHGKDVSAFSAVPDEQEVILMPGTRIRRQNDSLSFEDRLFVLHLEEIDPLNESNYLFEQIKQEYLRNNRLHRIMNPSKSYPIDQSYINLVMVTAEDQHDREKELCNVKHGDAMMGSYEKIYGVKTPIDIKNIFRTCKTEKKQVLVFGRAGIGKSTFCRYIAYQWAQGSLWSHYELLVVIPLRCLTESYYLSSRSYSLPDIVIKEVFPYELSQREEALFKEQFDTRKTLWVLDGYDEIVQNVPSHLKKSFKYLLNTPNHILTSRPYLNTLSYDVQMEITGFTDENIKQYIEQFFNQMKDDLGDVSTKRQTLLHLLDSNRSIGGIAHIPVNLELICSVWSDKDSSETQDFTITTLYTTVTTWLCRRYLISVNQPINMLSEEGVYQCCRKELMFLENLAFRAMEANTIIIRPSLLKKALEETKLSLTENPKALNFGVLKSFNEGEIGTHIELEKDYYFIHLSFQEYFAARYIVNALLDSSNQHVIAFIKNQKYNQRCTLLLTFVAGLLSQCEDQVRADVFWNAILGDPIDLVGVRHMQIIISCIEATPSKSTTDPHRELLVWIAQLIQHHISSSKYNVRSHLAKSLRTAQSVLYNKKIAKVLDIGEQFNNPDTICQILLFLSTTDTSHPPELLLNSIATSLCAQNADVIKTICTVIAEIGEIAATHEVVDLLLFALQNGEWVIRHRACHALRLLGKKAAEPEVISKLLIALDDKHEIVRSSACNALGVMSDIIATDEVISKLLTALTDKNYYVRYMACQTLGVMDEKVAKPLVIRKLMIAAQDHIDSVRSSARNVLTKLIYEVPASEMISELLNLLENEDLITIKSTCHVLELMGEEAATAEVINKLLIALGSENTDIRISVCDALGQMGKKVPTSEVINKLLTALATENTTIRSGACNALGVMGEKAATPEVISKLMIALQDNDVNVRKSVWQALGRMGEKAATPEVISKLMIALQDNDRNVRQSVWQAFGRMRNIVATTEIISKLVIALQDNDWNVRQSACEALGRMGEKAATPEVISKLMIALQDNDWNVRNSADKVLEKIDYIAQASEIINELLPLLENENLLIKKSVCKALSLLGENAATTEVVSKLMIALQDNDWNVRESACNALGVMGEKAATPEVLSKLMIALQDNDWNVRKSACEALGRMGEKAATPEVISKLMIALQDNDWNVRNSADEVLEKIDYKAQASEIINELLPLLENENLTIKESACQALALLGEKAATPEVISKLLIALERENTDIRVSVCRAFKAMGENAGTPEVISRLLITLEDKHENVRKSVCAALGQMGEKAATPEVVSKLRIVSKSERTYIASGLYLINEAICEDLPNVEINKEPLTTSENVELALGTSFCTEYESTGGRGKMTEKISNLLPLLTKGDWFDLERVRASLREIPENPESTIVINKFVNAICQKNDCEAVKVLREMFNIPYVLENLDGEVFDNVYRCEDHKICLEEIDVNRMLKIYQTTSSLTLLPLITENAVREGIAITIVHDRAVVYGTTEPIELRISEEKSRDDLIKALKNQSERLCLCFPYDK